MGVNVPLVKFIVVLASTMITVVSVSISGIIGWVGMVVPHIARIVVGSSYPKLSASSFLIGGIFLLTIDNIIISCTTNNEKASSNVDKNAPVNNAENNVENTEEPVEQMEISI
jgi:ABC-type Fe3+-siderophore transport system permease subunit